MENKIKKIVEDEMDKVVWDMILGDIDSGQKDFIRERMTVVAFKAIDEYKNTPVDNLRDNGDGSCNCRALMPGVCFFTEPDGSRCQCKCHFPKPEEEEKPCEHEWENGRCEFCGINWEPDDFSGATEGDR